jgi:lysophospholipase L1-like esterase
MSEENNIPTDPSEKKAVKWPLGKRILYGAVTVLLVLGFGECGLRLAGSVLKPVVDQSGDEVDDCNAIVIIAMGDSMTYGVGAPRDMAYPIQMVPFLKKTYPDIPFKVYNLGLPGSNTSEGLGRLYKFFVKKPHVQPDFAFVLYGVNNRWNLHDASFWDWDQEAKKNHLAAYLASSFQLNKAASVAAQGGAEAAAKSRGDYGVILEKTNWDVFFKSFDDDLLSRWIEHDYTQYNVELSRRHIQPIVLPYFSPRFERLNPLITRIADILKLPQINLEKPAKYYDLRKFFSNDNFHLNRAGYYDISKRLVAELSKMYDRPTLAKRLRKKQSFEICKQPQNTQP